MLAKVKDGDRFESKPKSDLGNSNENHATRNVSWDPGVKGGGNSTSPSGLGRLFYKSVKRTPLDDAVSRQRSRCLVAFMHEMWLRQTMCDVLVNCSDGRIMAHQAVLGAHSPTLASLFSRHATQCTATVNVCQVSRRTAAEVLNFLYTTDLRLNCRVIEQVVICAQILDLPVVLDVCDDYLIQSADTDNVLLHYSVAHNCRLEETKDRLLSVLVRSFDEIRLHPHYPLISREKLLEMIDHPRLNAGARDVFEGVLKWVDYDRAERIPAAREILRRLCLRDVEIETMTKLLDEYDWIMADPVCNALVVSIYRYHAILNSRKNQRSEVVQRYESNPASNPESNPANHSRTSIPTMERDDASKVSRASLQGETETDVKNTDARDAPVENPNETKPSTPSTPASRQERHTTKNGTSSPKVDIVKVDDFFFSERLTHRGGQNSAVCEDANVKPYPGYDETGKNDKP